MDSKGLFCSVDSNLYKQIIDVFNDIQKNSAAAQRNQILLINLYKSTDNEAFYKCFERVLRIILNQNPKDRNPNADKVCEFYASVCAAAAEAKPDNPICETLFAKVFDFLLELHNLNNETLRYRVCQMINKLLNSLVGTELDGDLCDRIENAMLERLQEDDKSEIRIQAIAAVCRLQNPLDTGCKVIPKLIQRLTDRSAKVRKICVERIGIQRDVIPALVIRTRDTNTDVRLAVFTKFAKLVKHMKIVDRHQVIINGFEDSSKEINNYVAVHLVPAWLSDYDSNYLKLLEAMCLDSTEKLIQTSTKVSEYILGALFRFVKSHVKESSLTSLISRRPCEEVMEYLKLDDKRMLLFEELNWVSAIYWRCLIEACRKSEEYEAILETVSPDLVHFADYILSYCNLEHEDRIQFQFILNQFFMMTQDYDVSDTVSRQALTNLIDKVVRSVDLEPNVVTNIIKNLEKTIPNVEKFTEFVCHIISSILHVVCEYDGRSQDTEFKIAELKVKLHEIRCEQDSAVQKEDYESAAKYKEELGRLKESLNYLQESSTAPQLTIKKTDAPTVFKCLNIARGMLASTKITTLTLALRTLNDDVILDFLTHEDNKVRAMAVECYALCCVVDRKYAEKGIHIFAGSLMTSSAYDGERDDEFVLSTIKAFSDVLVIYGSEIMLPPENNDEPEPTFASFSRIIQILADLMDDENVEIQQCAGLSLCKLISHGRVHSASLISRMILKWCNPASDECLRQHIGMMLEGLPSLPDSGNQLEKSVLLTIKTLLRAPKSSPLADVQIVEIIKFMLTLCGLCEEDSSLHSNLALSICGEMTDDPQNKCNFILSKTLLMLEISPDNKQLIRDLINVCEELTDKIQNRLILHNIEKYKAQLQALSTHDISAIREEIDE